MEDREELTLKEAAELLGLTTAQLLALLEEAGLGVSKGREVRLRAAEVLELQRERQKRKAAFLDELGRLGGQLFDSPAEDLEEEGG